MRQCPRATARGFGLLPYFLAYENSNMIVWPDGRGRYYQPTKLIAAFDLLSYYWGKFKADALKEVNKNGKKN